MAVAVANTTAGLSGKTLAVLETAQTWTATQTFAAITATTGSFSSTLGVTGDFSVNTNKFNVTAASGNTTVAGTLGVTGATTLTGALTAGAGSFSSTLTASAAAGITLSNASGVIDFTGVTTPKVHFSGANGRLTSIGSLVFQVDTDANGSESFLFRNGAGSNVVTIDENGAVTLSSTLTVQSAVVRAGTGTPEGVVTGSVGDLFLRRDGGAATVLYIKESGAGNTGWVAK